MSYIDNVTFCFIMDHIITLLELIFHIGKSGSDLDQPFINNLTTCIVDGSLAEQSMAAAIFPRQIKYSYCKLFINIRRQNI